MLILKVILKVIQPMMEMAILQLRVTETVMKTMKLIQSLQLRVVLKVILKVLQPMMEMAILQLRVVIKTMKVIESH